MVGAEDGDLLVEADTGAPVTLPGEHQEDRGHQQRGQLQPVLEHLHEGDRAHAARRDGHHHDAPTGEGRAPGIAAIVTDPLGSRGVHHG